MLLSKDPFFVVSVFFRFLFVTAFAGSDGFSSSGG